MADTAAHLADRVFPEAPVRQWVLSLPWPSFKKGGGPTFAEDGDVCHRGVVPAGHEGKDGLRRVNRRS
jgi:hypothetical protein